MPKYQATPKGLLEVDIRFNFIYLAFNMCKILGLLRCSLINLWGRGRSLLIPTLRLKIFKIKCGA